MRKSPIQARAKVTEEKLLNSFEFLVERDGYNNTTIQEVAERSGFSKSAFIKRFGSKEGALIVIFERYCEDVMFRMRAIRSNLDNYSSLHDVLRFFSVSFEEVLNQHRAANRAMYEKFLEEAQTHDLTKNIFKDSVLTMKAIQVHFLGEERASDDNAWSATQLLITVVYNYFLNAMPGLPRCREDRHSLIASWLEGTLKR